MGVEPSDCRIVARMVGVKTFINEFLAYDDLGNVKANRLQFEKYVFKSPNATWTVTSSGQIHLHETNVTLNGGIISVCGSYVNVLNILVPTNKQVQRNVYHALFELFKYNTLNSYVN